ncbi:MAG: phosphonoacetaldehyde hydrolase [Epulopiscium sp. Nele67-Bin004]|nr:MAG: phosphonoacetaldehyde hydrolase [Epulopiscium sp. Nele67-Bin004]
MIEAVIFDWAGTTVDYGCFAPVNAFVEAFRQYKIEPTLDEIRKPMGALKWQHIKTVLEMERVNAMWKDVYGRDFDDSDVDKIHDVFFEKLMESLHKYATPKPHVIDAVAKLREMDIKIGSTTGYTDDMMEIIVDGAKQQGYSPDFMCTPTMLGDVGRPYPYMVFKNMEVLKVGSVKNVVKVGDTVSDILEGVNAGVVVVGVVEGSSEMALNEEEYAALSEDKKQTLIDAVTTKYKDAGADYVILNMSHLPALVESL